MPHSQPQHAAPNPDRNIKAIRTVRFWAAPLVITVALMSTLCALYLGGILNPTTNLRHFPIAVVNEDAGPGGAQIADRLVNGLDKNKFDVRVLSRSEAKRQLDTARVYGQVLIPPSFSSKLRDFATSALLPARPDRPSITVSTNPRAGTLGASIAGQTLNSAMGMANGVAGQRVTAEVVAQTGGAPLPEAAQVGLSAPIDIQSNVYNPLPNGTGNGLSAFYYALLLLLAGFTGSIVVSTLVDALLGYVPAEFGPVYRFAEQVRISRFQTLLVKWAMMVLLGLITSAVYLAIADGLGMPIDHSWQLWAFGVFAIAAVGITSGSLLSVLGTAGLLVSMLIFVILGLPSAGATVPLEATPSFFRWLAEFEPMHQVFLGTRSLLYFGGRGDAGLTQALIMSTIGLVIGLLVGGIVTHLYDRKGFHRIPGAVELAIAQEHQVQHQARRGKRTEPGEPAATEPPEPAEPAAAEPEPESSSEQA
ncbi:YhgE/Pip domain-containing protein [Mycobacterium sp. M23085]|uniref:YhgE/Pip domain-containing protein n=1 Tax=Mycobacterium sp. M23085 TaxID=3378087 RepID=UPI003877D3B0